jgi:hypothetical protein
MSPSRAGGDASTAHKVGWLNGSLFCLIGSPVIKSHYQNFVGVFLMAKKPGRNPISKAGRSQRVRLTAEESVKRVSEFAQRKEAFVAAVRKGKDRGVSA